MIAALRIVAAMSFAIRRFAAALAALLFAMMVGYVAGEIAGQRARANLENGLAADARLRQALLASELERFELLPVALADDVDVRAALAGQAGAAVRLDGKLAALAREAGAAAIYLIAPSGRAIAANNAGTAQSFVGQDYRFRRYYADARRTGAGRQFALGTVSRRPGLYLSRRTPGGGVIVVKLEFDRIEQAWRAAGGDTFVTDRDGIVRVTSHPEWRFAATRPLPAARAAAVLADGGVAALRPSPVSIDPTLGRVRVAGIAGPVALAKTRPDASGWRVHLAMAAAPAVRPIVRAAQGSAALVTLALIGIGWAWRARARRRAERTVALETAVSERTAALRREIEERAAVEARAADLRESLRQANRLAALGQITASVAHETAQPVAAIRTYAATGERLLDRGETEEVRTNLRAIARLTERIGAVTAELRGFARKGSGAIQPVPLVEVIDGARLILKERLQRIAFVVPPIPADLRVVAGRVRLEQVLVNLLQNAIEALHDRADARIALDLATDGDLVHLTVRDNGPGIAPEIADRIFTPFATSRPNGLGLGLVIAQDIMADLGGALHLLAADGGGAAFRLTLRRAA
ncbi:MULTISPECIES: ATP-binding protein [unclassified Sphingomonas]|uniref:sensor histidine kinase n=1 Tax=unclassified Sphingomonas TaxID=196159 RepID=UPI001E2D6460|nr:MULTISPECIES: ATP-binding protein [unclassified Sphingomonas]